MRGFIRIMGIRIVKDFNNFHSQLRSDDNGQLVCTNRCPMG